MSEDLKIEGYASLFWTRDLNDDVTAAGPAEKAGILLGDIIIEFNGRPVNAMRDLPKFVAETPIGDKVPVKVLRKGKEVDLTAARRHPSSPRPPS